MSTELKFETVRPGYYAAPINEVFYISIQKMGYGWQVELRDAVAKGQSVRALGIWKKFAVAKEEAGNFARRNWR